MLRTVMTENGFVRGLPGNNARITAFKGIPFAAPPVGKNRWKAPQPCENWTGIRNAYSFAPISIQDTPGLGRDLYSREWHVDSQIEMSEDCLYLNVWTGADSRDDKLPVLVWIFGGGFQWGYTSEMEFNGENIAKRGVVVVSINYRLAAFGFLAHPDITKENPDTPANFGLLDQLAGLEWVKRNIAAFGGDPDNITLAGQSAGGASVLSHITSSRSKDLIHKAVIFSGIIRSPYETDTFIIPQSLSYGEDLGKKFFASLGVNSLEEARKIDAMVIRDAYGKFVLDHPRLSPVLDGYLIEEDPFVRLLTGKHNHIPMIAGNTRDEFQSVIPADSEEEFTAKAGKYFGEDAHHFLSMKEAQNKDAYGYAPCSSIEYAVKSGFGDNHANTYYYCFEPDIPGEDSPGTFHSVDLWFFFETLAGSWRPFVGRHYDLARQMCNYLTNFVKTGDPNGNDIDDTGMEKWLPYSEDTQNEMHFTAAGPKAAIQENPFADFIINSITKRNLRKKKQAFNPYLPSWEYIPDGEPYVFGNRVYVYGSHDCFRGHAFCLNDYVCWSAPVDDLGNWRYEGVIYTRLDDPENSLNNMCLYAPDVVKGPDGKYYLYYVLDKLSIVSVAVCDTPAGKYEFLGYVHYPDGTRLGEGKTDEPQFDPGVILVDNKVYLYTGFCGIGDKSRSGAMLTILDKDMLTVLEAPKIIVPGSSYSRGTEFENHAFFEASSIRCFDNKYYFIYSSEVMHELCYAISDSPMGPFRYGGVIVSNADLHIDSYKPADKPAAYGGNNHGSLVEIGNQRYIFYHRQTLNIWYSRQGCAEPVSFREDGSILQSEITSCGLNQGPLNDQDEYPAYLACNMFTEDNEIYVGGSHVPWITQEGRD
ncbi:MAG: carboxylesterase family protein, partial [Lachnospiraceae bacterium]